MKTKQVLKTIILNASFFIIPYCQCKGQIMHGNKEIADTVTTQQKIEWWQNELQDANIDVADAQQKYEDAQKFHVGRTEEKKQKDISDAYDYLKGMSNYVDKCKAYIYRLQHTTHKVPSKTTYAVPKG